MLGSMTSYLKRFMAKFAHASQNQFECPLAPDDHAIEPDQRGINLNEKHDRDNNCQPNTIPGKGGETMFG